MNRTTVVLLTFGVMLISCQRDRPAPTNNISGTITEINTGNLVTNETVAIYKTSNGILGGEVEELTAETTTDNNGQYNFSINESTNRLVQYIITLQNDNRFYFTGYEEIKKATIIDNKEIVRDFSVNPAATVAFRIRNVSPFDSLDQIYSIRFDAARPYMPTNNVTLYGMDVDTTISIQMKSDQFNRVTCYYNKNNIQTYFEDSIFVTSFGTLSYNLEY